MFGQFVIRTTFACNITWKGSEGQAGVVLILHRGGVSNVWATMRPDCGGGQGNAWQRGNLFG